MGERSGTHGRYTLNMKSFSSTHALPVLIGSALLIQVLGRYHAHAFSIGHFYYSWILLRIVLPLLLVRALGIPFGALGLGLPAFDRFFKILCILTLFGLFGVYLVIHFSPTYLGHYAKGWGAVEAHRFGNFMVFTLSTLTGWEFLHRSFLLMGTVYILGRHGGISESTTRQAAVSIVWSFEVLFHLLKPRMEALGMLIGSPFLSYITLKTGSIWPAFLIHLGVEIVFILSF
jgi:hypothetical protein